jgi:hypothetical protein
MATGSETLSPTLRMSKTAIASTTSFILPMPQCWAGPQGHRQSRVVVITSFLDRLVRCRGV